MDFSAGSICQNLNLCYCRRSLSLGLLLGSLDVMCRPVLAKHDYEPMEGLKGRDYGKERQR